ncbi:MAG: peptidoglycan-associated lipoprotein Pal [Nitrospira sp.]|nr:peptidoglycan-associated lipoprotein Pal [Nitrospira sp.]
MPTRCHLSSFRFCLCLLIVAILSGCSSRKIVTAVEDQSTIQRAATETPAPVAAATVSPQIPPEPPKAEPAAPVEPAPVQPEPVRIEKIMPPPVVEEARRMEQPPAPTPTPAPALSSQPTVRPAQPVTELSDIFFDFDRFTVRGDAQPVLEADAGILKLQPDQQIVIEGHCDERGTSAYNLVLGERRAQSAKHYLQVLGVPASQIRITSYGKERPFCTEHSEDCWQSNRRAHFRRP